MTRIMGAGKRNKYITLQDIAQTVTDEGELTETVNTSTDTWASIQPLSARERLFANQSQATTTHTITTIYIADVSTRWRATWDGRTFNFDSVVNVNEDDRELLITATEVTEGN